MPGFIHGSVALALGLALAGAPLLTSTATVAHAASESSAEDVVLELSPAKQSVVAGSRVVYRARLLDEGAVLPGRRIAFDQRRGDGSWVYLTSVSTGSDGRAAMPRTVQSSQVVRARFAGDERTGAAWSPWSYVTATQPPFGTRVVNEAAKHRGKPYRWGAVGPNAFDCSGFTMYVFKRFGISLPHNSKAQYDATTKIARNQIRPGDLIFNASGGSIHHVAIYAGNGQIWHSPQSGRTVSKAPIYGTWLATRVR